MALQRTRLTQIVQAPASIGAVYTNPAATKSFVRGFIVTNIDASNRILRIDWVPASGGSVGTPSNATKLFSAILLVPNETLFLDCPYAIVMLDANETIQALADAANVINMVVLGDQDT